ncbi:transposase [Enterococcus gallinarum]|nr:transposase [Enterococcus gallinarum]
MSNAKIIIDHFHIVQPSIYNCNQLRIKIMNRFHISKLEG